MFQSGSYQLDVANSYKVSEWRMNSAFSPDTVGTPSGFNELAAIYNFYRVIGVKFYFRVAANETSLPVQFGAIARDTQPSTTITTYAKAINSLEVAPSTGINLIGGTTGMSVYRSQEYTLDCGSIVGNRLEYLSDIDYRGLITGQPSQVVWLAFVTCSVASGTNLTNGLYLDMFIILDTIFTSTKVVEV